MGCLCERAAAAAAAAAAAVAELPCKHSAQRAHCPNSCTFVPALPLTSLTCLPTCLAYSLPLVQELLDGVRNTVNSVGAGWSREEKDACLQETPATFTWGGQLVSLITGGKPVGPH